MDREVRGLPLFYSCIRLMRDREGESKRKQKEESGGIGKKEHEEWVRRKEIGVWKGQGLLDRNKLENTSWETAQKQKMNKYEGER